MTTARRITADAWPPGRARPRLRHRRRGAPLSRARRGTCRCAIVLARYIQPEPEVQLVIDQLRLTLPARPPPKIHRPRLRANAPGVVRTFWSKSLIQNQHRCHFCSNSRSRARGIGKRGIEERLLDKPTDCLGAGWLRIGLSADPGLNYCREFGRAPKIKHRIDPGSGPASLFL